MCRRDVRLLRFRKPATRKLYTVRVEIRLAGQLHVSSYKKMRFHGYTRAPKYRYPSHALTGDPTGLVLIFGRLLKIAS